MEYERSYSVSNDRTILVNGLKPGTTYTTILVASDGISAETKSDPQMVATLSKGMFSLSLYFLSLFQHTHSLSIASLFIEYLS